MELGKKILLLSTTDVHGAYEAIYRIAYFLKKAGYEVAMLVKTKTKSEDFIIEVSKARVSQKPSIIHRIFIKLGLRKTKRPIEIKKAGKYLFLDEDEQRQNFTADDLLKKLPFKPDLIISGINNGFINTTALADLHEATGAKVALITVDMYSFTGGCHYAWECTGYQRDCSDCPGMLDAVSKAWPQENLRIKQANVKRGNIQIVAGSQWTVDQARSSTLFREQPEILNTNSCIDTDLFNPKNRSIAKQVFGIPADAKVIFTGSFGVHDPRKGFTYFVDALKQLWPLLDEEVRKKTHILVVGQDSEHPILNEIPFQKFVIDYIKDYRLLSLAYQSADVFVCASVEDSGPMMVSEALACGTPVVGFEMGIVCNMVETGYNGYKAKLKDSADMAFGMKTILSLDKEEANCHSLNAVEQVRKYSAMDRVLKIVHKLL